jgi:hypothetical protein
VPPRDGEVTTDGQQTNQPKKEQNYEHETNNPQLLLVTADGCRGALERHVFGSRGGHETQHPHHLG